MADYSSLAIELKGTHTDELHITVVSSGNQPFTMSVSRKYFFFFKDLPTADVGQPKNQTGFRRFIVKPAWFFGFGAQRSAFVVRSVPNRKQKQNDAALLCAPRLFDRR